jgi:hypothetical protein
MLRSEYSAAPWPRLPGGSGSALGFGAAIAATLLGWALGAGTNPEIGLVPLAAVAVCVGATTTLPGALAAAAQCWGMYSGFELHRFGELRLDPPARSALVLLVVLGLAASVLGLVAHAARTAGSTRKRASGPRRVSLEALISHRESRRPERLMPVPPAQPTLTGSTPLRLAQPPRGRKAG